MDINEINPIIRYSWSRSHCDRHNYLTIEQTAYICVNNTCTVVKKGKIIELITEGYKLDEIKQRKTEDDITSKTHTIYDSMEPENVSTKDYKHFRIVFANMKEIIVNNYDEFLNIVKAEKLKANHSNLA